MHHNRNIGRQFSRWSLLFTESVAVFSLSHCRLGCRRAFVRIPLDTGTIEEVIQSGPLHTRAWCFQELYLSPRKLYFGRHGIFWSCFTGEASEHDPEGRRKTESNSEGRTLEKLFGPRGNTERQDRYHTPPVILDRVAGPILVNVRPAQHRPIVHKPWMHEIQGNVSLEHGSLRHTPDIIDKAVMATEVTSAKKPLALFHGQWFNIVGAYSKRQLTRPEDRLIAFVVIVKHIQQRNKFTYVLGTLEGDNTV